MKNKIDIKDIFKYTGAIVAFLIGSGFASGQEVMQFFSSYGTFYSALSLIVSFIIFSWIVSSTLVDAKRLKLEKANSIFKVYCGKYLGTFFEWLIPVFLYMIYVVMVSGAGALTSEYFGINANYGRFIMVLISLITVLLGLENLINIVSRIGIVIIISIIIISLISLSKNFEGFKSADSFITTVSIVKATPFWWLSGITYATFCAITILPFLSGLGKNSKSELDSRLGGISGSFFFIITAAVLSYAILASISLVWSKNVPSVFIADKLWKGAGIIFSIAMLLGLYTTAVPMFWSVCNKISSNEKSIAFRIGAVVLAVISYFGGSLPFATLVNIVYPYMGYLGLVLFVCIAIHRSKEWIKKKFEK